MLRFGDSRALGFRVDLGMTGTLNSVVWGQYYRPCKFLIQCFDFEVCCGGFPAQTTPEAAPGNSNVREHKLTNCGSVACSNVGVSENRGP